MTKSDSALTSVKQETMLRVPFGFASPLWGFFAGAAVGGTAWWLMTRWARPANLEAMFGAAAEPDAPPEVATEVVAAALEAPSVAVEAAEVPVVEVESPASEPAPMLEADATPTAPPESPVAAPELSVEPEPAPDQVPVLAAEAPAAAPKAPTRKPRARKAAEEE